MGMRSESEVGILYRIPFGTQAEEARSRTRLIGLLKQRFSDFHVHEIDESGEILHLNSFKLPNEAGDETSMTTSLDEECNIQNENLLLNWLPQSLQEEVKRIQSLTESNEWSLEINVTSADKETRTRIHRWLGHFDKLSSKTVERDGGKFIQISRQLHKDRGVLERRPYNRAKYTHCVLYKEGIDTSDAINFLCRKLRMNPKHITFAGTKDKQAKTIQQICFSNIDAKRLLQINGQSLHSKLGNFSYKDSALHLGQLKGNHFKILIRNVNVHSDAVISTAIHSLSSDGFINYFGLQRFGSFRTTHLIGKALFQMNWLKAFDLILEPNDRRDQSFMKKAKKLWLEKRDAVRAWKEIPRHHQSNEASLLHGLSKFYATGDHWSSIRTLPRNMRTLYFHAFQSYLWNHLATHRIKEYGLLPVVGDLVFIDSETEASLGTDLEIVGLDEACLGIGEDSKDGNMGNSPPVLKVLSQEDLTNYTIFDVVIPIEGSEVKIPGNSILKAYSDKLLVENGISEGFPSFRPRSELPKGSFRKVVVLPKDVNHQVIPYNEEQDNLDTFIPSDYDLMVQKEKPSAALPFPIETPLEKDKTCVIVQFSLPSSSYATMALRQILDDTSPEMEQSVSVTATGEKRGLDSLGTKGEEESSSSVPKKLKDGADVSEATELQEDPTSSFAVTAGEQSETFP